MNIKSLEYLVMLDKHRHFGKAAEACFVSQPTLSGQLKKLEEQLGISLVERTSRRVLLTPKGQSLVLQAKRVLGEIQHFKALAKDNTLLSGPFHLGVIPTVGPYVLPSIIPLLKQAIPDIELFVHEAHTHVLIEKLQQGELDCLLLAQTPDTEVLKTFHITNEALLLAVNKQHQWAKSEHIEMEKLAGTKLLVLEDGHCLQQDTLKFCFAAGAKDDERFKASSLETLRSMVAAGVGITLMPEFAVKSNDPLIHYINAINPSPSRALIVAARVTSETKAINKLAEIIRTALK